MDLSQFSTEDLLALKAGDLTKVSDAGLMSLKQSVPSAAAAPSPTTPPKPYKETILLPPGQNIAPVTFHDAPGSPSTPVAAPAPKPPTFEGLDVPGADVVFDRGHKTGPMTSGESFLRGMVDPIMGVNQLAMHTTGNDMLAGQMDHDLQQREQNYQARRSMSQQDLTGVITGKPADPGVDWWREGGRLVGTIPASFVGAPPGASLLTRMAVGAGMGGLSAASNPVYSPEEDYWSEKRKQVGEGAAVGGIAGPVGGAVLGRVLSPKTAAPVKELIDQGITPTPGQILGGVWQQMEDKATSLPIVGDAIKFARRGAVQDLNRAVYARTGVMPTSVGRDAVAEISDKLGQEYEDLLPRLHFQADHQFAADLSKVAEMSKLLPEAEAWQFENLVRNQLIGKLTPQGNASGETIKTVESELGRLARGYNSSGDQNQRQLGAALEAVQASVRDALQRSNPQAAAELANLNERYAAYALIRRAAGMQSADHGVFTGAQLSSAVRAGDRSVGHGNFARGRAYGQDLSDPAKSVLGEQYPNSGTAGRVLFGSGALLSGAVAPKIPIMLGAASLPYLPGARQATAAVLTKRPDWMRVLGDKLQQLGPALWPAAALPTVSQPNNE